MGSGVDDVGVAADEHLVPGGMLRSHGPEIRAVQSSFPSLNGTRTTGPSCSGKSKAVPDRHEGGGRLPSLGPSVYEPFGFPIVDSDPHKTLRPGPHTLFVGRDEVAAIGTDEQPVRVDPNGVIAPTGSALGHG